MHDRELLELAAKACNYTIAAGPQAQRDESGHGDAGLWIRDVSTCWNPLKDDADAFRVAVNLQLPVHRYGAGVAVNGRTYIAAEGEDGRAATRRAITEAAAEIGKRSNA